MKSHLLFLLIFGFTLNLQAGSRLDKIPDSGMDQWVKSHFKKGSIPLFSFRLDGKKSEEFIKEWQFSQKSLPVTEANSTKREFCYVDPAGKLEVRCHVTEFSDFNAVEWVLYFVNRDKTSSPILDKVSVLDETFAAESPGNMILHHSRGSNAERSDFQSVDLVLKAGSHEILSPSGGRSSDKGALPFFNVEAPGGKGVVFAIGWTGKWMADIRQSDEKTFCVNAGMEKMEISLEPGEEIRTPQICLLFWAGNNRMEGHNRFRQFILAHHTRKIDGKFARYPLSGSFDYGDPQPCGEYNCLTEDFAIALVKRYEQFRILPEQFWLDAGWYEGCGWDKPKGEWWQNVGNWNVDLERFPHGLKRISDEVHRVGARFMVWFEPERVRPQTMVDKEHPEWLIRIPGKDDYLFDLGNKEARLWMTDHISNLIRKEGIDIYRQDFNFDPMPYWDSTNKPGRIGIKEIRHIEGLYAFWDSLLVRFPNLLIDNCASGGRRIDLETTSRSAPLWRTDYQYGEPNGYQCHTYGLNFYLPVHGTAVYKTDPYTFRSGLGATAVMNWEVTGRDSESIPSIQKAIREFRELRDFYYGDFYPLTEGKNLTRENNWLAYQMNRPQNGDGIIMAFRRLDCSEPTIRINPCGLDPASTYNIEYSDYGISMNKSGKEIMNGLDISIPQRPSSLLVRYRKH